MKVPFSDLLLQYQSIRSEIDAAFYDVVQNSAFVGGKYVKGFESEFATYCNAKYCVGVGNGTDAIYVALRALGIGRGDEVITAANSFIATSEAITMTGASVVFVDCNPETYTMDIQKLSDAISPRTKAIIPVHLYGQPANMPAVMEIAEKNNLFVIEDAAQAHGSSISGRRVGTFGQAACFSFYPGKNLGAYGDGGAIVTNDENIATACRMIANHGRKEKYDHKCEGINSRLDGMQAAILTVKLKYLDEWTEKRRWVAEQYNMQLKNSCIITPWEAPEMRHVYHLYVVRVRCRESVQKYLSSAEISTGIHYPIALPNLQAYKYLNKSPGDYRVASELSNEILSLPMFPELNKDQIMYVCEKLKMAVSQ